MITEQDLLDAGMTKEEIEFELNVGYTLREIYCWWCDLEDEEVE